MSTRNKITPDTVIDSSEMGDLDTMMRRFVSGIQSDLQVCIPAVVRKYDRGAKTAVVVPLVKLKYVRDGKEDHVIRGELNVRVRQMCCGGFAIDIPLFVGDTGWVIASDVDTSILRQHGNAVCRIVDKNIEVEKVQNDFPQVPGTNGTHDFENGFFIPDCWASFHPGNINAGETSIGENSFYLGESIEGTCTIDKNGKSSLGSEKDGLASVSITRGVEGKRGNITLAVGKRCSIVIDGTESNEKVKISSGESCSIVVDGASGDEKVKLSVGDTEILVSKEKVSISGTSLELPENTTVGGKSFTEQALA